MSCPDADASSFYCFALSALQCPRLRTINIHLPLIRVGQIFLRLRSRVDLSNILEAIKQQLLPRRRSIAENKAHAISVARKFLAIPQSSYTEEEVS